MTRLGSLKRLLIASLLAFTATSSALAVDVATVPNPEGRILDGVYWTDSAPVIDGKPDDACWRSAALAKDFRILGSNGKLARERTEVRICYDATHLYLCWKAFESQMEKVDSGPPLDRHDSISDREYVQVMLDPGYRGKDEHFTFSASPLGAHQDSGGGKRLLFECGWRVAGGRVADGWIMEMAIPFAELADSRAYRATPQPGDVWGLALNRAESPRGELSQWTLTGGTFGNYGCVGKMIFKGRRGQSTQPKVESLGENLLFFGPGEVGIKISNSRTLARAVCSLSKDGKPWKLDRGDVTTKWRMPYNISTGGRWQLDIELSGNGKPFYVARAETNLPAVTETIQEVRAAVAVARAKLANLDHPVANRLKQSFGELEKELAASETFAGRTDQLTRQEWLSFVKTTESLRAKWKALSLDANLLRFYRAGQRFALGTARTNEKIYPDSIRDASSDKPIQMSATGNEYESAQLVVMPFWEELRNLSVVFSDLRGAKGVISADNLTWSQVKYVRIPDDAQVVSAHKHVPDILWPGEPFTVPAGAVQPLWIDVYVPKGTPAGDYQGKVTVKSDGFETSRVLMVRVRGFDLPEENTLQTNHWYHWGNAVYQFGAFYCGKVAFGPALWERHVKTLARYRAQQHYIHECSELTPATLEPDGHFTFDFSRYDEYLRIGKKYHANCLWLRFLSPTILNPKTPVVERKTGKPVMMEAVIADALRLAEGGKAWWRSSPAFVSFYTDYVKGVVAYLRGKGVLGQTVCEVSDEAFDDVGRWLGMIDHVSFLKPLTPDLTIISLGVNPTQSLEGKNAIGLLNAWGPHLFQCDDPAVLAACRQRQKHHEPFWFYTCTSRQGPGGYSPFHSHLAPFLQQRMHGWMAWTLGVDAFMTYIVYESGDWQKNVKANPAERWPAGEWYTTGDVSGHNLVYPGPEPKCDLIPSIRLSSMRDGVEDYEYFALLRRKAASLDRQRDGELMAAIDKELRIEPEIIRTMYEYTDDIQLLAAKRDRLASLIERASQAARGGK